MAAPVIYPIIARLITWLGASYVTWEITDLFKPAIEKQIGQAEREEPNAPKKPIGQRWGLFLIIGALAAGIFYAIKTVLDKIFNIPS